MSGVWWEGCWKAHAGCICLCQGNVVVHRVRLRFVGIGSVIGFRNGNGVQAWDLPGCLHGRVHFQSSKPFGWWHCHGRVIVGDLRACLVRYVLPNVWRKRTLVVHAISHRFLLVGRRDRAFDRPVRVVPWDHTIRRSGNSVVHGSSIWHPGMTQRLGAWTRKPTRQMRQSGIGIGEAARPGKWVGTATGSLHVRYWCCDGSIGQRASRISICRSLCTRGGCKVAATGRWCAQWGHGIFILAAL